VPIFAERLTMTDAGLKGDRFLPAALPARHPIGGLVCHFTARSESHGFIGYRWN